MTTPDRALAPRRRAPRPGVPELLDRLAAVETRLARVEAGKPPPGDGRSGVPRPARRVRRCPGCGLPSRRRGGRCAWCGLPSAR